MKIEINTNQGAIDLDTDDLPGELKDLYSFLEEKSVTLSSYLILAVSILLKHIFIYSRGHIAQKLK